MNEQTVREPTMQSIAQQWASTTGDQHRADEKERLARDEAERLRQRAKTLAEMLVKRVGPNATALVFDVAPGEVVLVEHGQGVRLLKAQPKDR